MAFCTPEGGNGTRGEAEGAISPRGCTKPMDPSHRVQQLFCYTFVKLLFLFSKFCCHLQTLLRRTIHCLISRRTRNNFLEPAIVSYTARNRPTLGTIKVMYTRCTSLFMRFCCASHDWFSSLEGGLKRRFYQNRPFLIAAKGLFNTTVYGFVQNECASLTK